MPSYTPNYSLAKPDVNSPTDEDLWGGELNDDMDIIDTTMKSISDTATAALGSAVPIGAVLDFAGSSAPVNFLMCYGQAVSRVTYAGLFSAIGTTYGAGDGTTTFNLPDARGRVGAGKDDMGGVSANRLTGLSGGVDGDVLGGTGGSQTHTLIVSETPAHRHFVLGDVTGSSGFPTASNQMARQSNQALGNNDYSTQGTATDSTIGRTSSIGGDGAHNNIQPTIIFNKIIKAL